MIDDKKAENTFSKGWVHDLTEEVAPNQVATDILNMQIVEKGGKLFRLFPNDGTEEVIVSNPKYKVIGFGKSLNHVIVFSANASNFGDIGIATYDESGPSWSYTPLYCHKDLNFSTLNPIQSQYVRDNELIQRSYFWDDRNPLRVINIGDPVYTIYFASGSLVTDDFYMVLKGTVTYGGTAYGPNETAGTVFQCTSGNGATYTSTGSTLVIEYVPIELIDNTPKFTAGQADFYKWLQGGSLTNGVYKYWYQLEHESGVRSPWIGESNGVSLTNEIIDEGALTGVKSYQDYQGLGGQTGAANTMDINTGKGIQVKITGIDTNFTKIRVLFKRSVGYNIFGNGQIFAEQTITGSTMFIDHMGGDSLEEIVNETMLIPNVGILKNRAAKIGHNTLFMGNYKLRHSFDWQIGAAATIRPILKEVLSDVADAEFGTGPSHPDSTSTLKLVGHGEEGINKVYENQWYRVDGGTINYDPGTGNIVIPDGGVFKPTGASGYLETISVASGFPRVIPVFRIRKYGGEYKYIDILDDFRDGKGMTADAHIKSYWRDETYRFGLVPVDLWGNDYPVYYIDDVKMPAQSETALNSHDSVATTDDAGLIKTTTNDVHFMKHLGLEFDIDFNELVAAIVEFNPELDGITYSDLPNYFKGFKIVRAPRDKQIVFQGMVRPTWRWEDPGSGNEYISPIMGDGNRDSSGADNRDGYIEFAASVVRQQNFYELFSPDHLLRFNDEQYIPEESDQVKVVQYLDDPSRINPTVGTEHTADRNFYSKYVTPATPLSNMTPIGTVTNVDPRWTLDYQEGDTPKITQTQWPYVGFGYLVDPSLIVTNPFYKRVAVAGKKLMLFTKADETGGDADFINGLGYLNQYTFMKPIVNIKKSKSSLYGGTSKEALANTEYINIGHYQPFDSDFMNHLADTSGGKAEGAAIGMEVWGGDAYVQLFDFNHLIQYGDPSTGLDVTPLGLPHGVSPVNAFPFSHSMIFPVESNINIGLREGRHIAKDKSYSNGVVNPNGIAYGTGAWDKPENLLYNDAYSAEQTGLVNTGAEVYKSTALNREHEYRWSATKRQDERIDSLRQWPVSQVRIADSQSGPITNLLLKYSKLFMIQEQGITYAGVNERGMIPDSLGQIITMGVSNIADYSDSVNKTHGNKYRLGTVEFDGGWLFYDAYNKCIVMLAVNGDVVKASAVMGIDFWIKEHIREEFILVDSPIDYSGVVGYFDPKYKMAVLSFINGFNTPESSSVAILFDTINKQFSGKSNLCPAVAIDYKGTVVCSSPNNIMITDGELEPATAYTAFESYLLENENLYMCILGYTTSGSPTAISSDTTHWKLINKQHSIAKMHAATTCKFFGLFYPYYVKFVVNVENEVSKVFNNQELIGLGNKFFTSVIASTRTVAGSDVNMDINQNREYEYIDGIWFSSLPLASNGERLVGTELSVTLYNRNYVLSASGVADKSLSINYYTPITKVITLYNYMM